MTTDGRYTLMFDEHTFFVWDNENDERMTALNVTKKLNEQQDTIRRLQDLCGESDAENAKLRQDIKKLKEEEKLYAQEILRLNELVKQYQSFKDLGGDY